MSDDESPDLTQNQVEKLVQLQDLTGIDDISVCRALLESKDWDLEATAREQFEVRDPPTPPPPLRPHDEDPAPEIRQRLFGGEDPDADQDADEGGGDLMRWGFYWLTFPVVWPVRLVLNVVSGALWSVASFLGFVEGSGRSTIRGRGRTSPSSSGEPLQDVQSFRTYFDRSFPGHTLTFFNGTYSQALEAAKKELKFLVCYLHSPEHQDAHEFCWKTLCSPAFSEFINDKVLFGCSVVTAEGHRVSQAIRANSYPVVAVIVLRQNKMMIVGRQEGTCAAQVLVDRFRDVVADNEAFIVAARADRAERDMNQAIRQEQDAAFQETLRQDQEKARLKKQLEEEKRKVEEEEERIRRQTEERKERIRQAKMDLVSLVPEEPDSSHPDAVRIVIKLPQGQRLERRFLRTASLKFLFYFVFCHPDSPDEFDITTNFPRKVLPCRPKTFMHSIGVNSQEDPDQTGCQGQQDEVDADPPTFTEAGIGQSTMLFVTDLEA